MLLKNGKTMVLEYKQQRAVDTRERFLTEFGALILSVGYQNVNLTEVADRAKQSKSSFLKHFGSKQNALIVIFERYCEDVKNELRLIRKTAHDKTCIHDVVFEMCKRFESLLNKHKAANRAMLELFSINLEVHERTKEIFKQTLETLEYCLRIHKPDTPTSKENLFAACQILVTLTYDYSMGAMPGFFSDTERRYRSITNCVVGILTS